MKRQWLFVVLAISLGSLTGCGNKYTGNRAVVYNFIKSTDEDWKTRALYAKLAKEITEYNAGGSLEETESDIEETSKVTETQDIKMEKASEKMEKASENVWNKAVSEYKTHR